VVRDVYNQIAGQYAGLYEGEGPLPHFYNTRLQLVGDILGPKPIGTLLDVGSGPGIVGDTVRALGFRYIASDQSVGMTRECRDRAGPTGEVAVAQASALPFDSGVFNVVTALGVLEYVGPLDAALAECRRVLRDDGSFVVSLLNKSSPFRILQSVRRRLGLDPDPIPPAHFSQSEVQRMLSAAGFRVQSVRYFDFQLLPFGFAQNHPRWSGRLTRVAERASSTPLRWLGSAMLIDASRV
jgi:SAM-dependent methyltransferase